MARCPDCGALIDIDEDEVEQGDTVSCPECAVDLEVVNTNPLELDIIEEEEEEENLEEFEEEDVDEDEEEEENGY